MFRKTSKKLMVLSLSTICISSLHGVAIAKDMHHMALPAKSSQKHGAYLKDKQIEQQVAFIEKTTHGTVNVIRSFNPGVKSLTGFVISAKSKNSKPIVSYVDNKSTYMVVGAVLNKKGINITYANTLKYVRVLASENAYKDLKNTYTFIDGDINAPHKVTVIADPNCIYCHKLYESTRGLIGNGDLAIKWLMVGVMKKDSRAMAAAILASDDPLQSFITDEYKFDAQNETGGIHPLSNIPFDIAKKIDANNAFMKRHQFYGTPVMIYKEDGKAKITQGYVQPKQLTQMLPSISSTF